MKISKIRIENYKSIKDITYDLQNNNVFVGPNDHGKSNILNAINDMFNLSLDFNGFTTDRSYYKKNKRRGSNSSAPLRFSFYVTDLPSGLRITRQKKNQYGISIRVMATGEVKFCMNNKKLDSPSSKNNKTARERYLNIKNRLNVVYVPTFRDIEEHLQLNSEKAALFNLISRALFESVERKQGGTTSVYRTIKKINTDITKLVEKTFSDMTKDIGKYLPGNSNLDLSFGFLDLDGESADLELSRNIARDVFIKNNKTQANITELGSGIQQAVTIALLEKILIVQNKTNLLLFEEPESFLHPNAQRELYTKICELNKRPKIQTVFSSHSTAVIDATSMSEVIITKKNNKGITQIFPFTITKDFSSQEYHRLVLEKTFRNSELFYADFVILVEGSSDKLVLEEIIKSAAPELVHRICIIDVGGKDSFNLTTKFLESYRDNICAFSWLIIADKDILESESRPLNIEKNIYLKESDWTAAFDHSATKTDSKIGKLNPNLTRIVSKRINNVLDSKIFILEADLEYTLSKCLSINMAKKVLLKVNPGRARDLEDIDELEDLAKLLGSKGPGFSWKPTKAIKRYWKKPHIAKSLAASLNSKQLPEEISRLVGQIRRDF